MSNNKPDSQPKPSSGSTPELARLPQARRVLGEAIVSPPWLLQLIDETRDPVQVGQALWRHATGRNQQDDRALYWQRLAAQAQLLETGVTKTGLAVLESCSRGLDGFHFGSAQWRIGITGFDPFHLDDEITQGNPSGLAALQLHGQRWQTDAGDAQIQSAIVPVRYADFDRGVIEDLIERNLHQLDMLITISMGRDAFDLERFPGRRRSVLTPDNCGLTGGGTAQNPVAPRGCDGPEFVEFTLPALTMCEVTGPYAVRDNTKVNTLESGWRQAPGLDTLVNETAVEGSGGGYLSNEISYRAISALRGRKTIPVGHIHTPRIEGYQPEVGAAIVQQCHQLIRAALSALSAI